MPSDGFAIIYNAFAALSRAGDVGQRWQALAHTFADLGADQVNYAVLNLAHASRYEAGVTQFSSMRPDWIDHYLETEMYLDDIHVQRVRDGHLMPYRFAGEEAEGWLEGRKRIVIAEAAEAGLRSQVSVIMPDHSCPALPLAGMTIGSSLPAAEFNEAVAGKEGALIAIGMLFHSLSIGEIRREQVGATRLSARERDCLSYFAEGYRVARIAEALGLADATVNLHLSNARRKLKAQTTAHAVARAMLFGDLIPGPSKTAR